MSISTSTEYDFKSIEPKWQRAWDERSAFTPGDNDTRPKYYALSMFPYPSGALHVGHMRNYTLVDVVTRYRMAKGYAVINPMGWDAFGLPAENAAIERGVHPAKWTYKNIEHMRGQFKRVGFGFDWSREVFTCREDYYKWTQWIFLQMLKHKGKSGEPVAYRKTGKVNWCPKDQTVLANEQVVKIERQGQTYDGCFRCGTKVVQKEMAQWALRITDYADELLDKLSELEPTWPAHVIAQQREWIGRSHGVNITFKAKIGAKEHDLTVYTTRADTVFGVTFVAIAPEHALVAEIVKASPKGKDVQDFVDRVLDQDQITREAAANKEGIDTGLKATHPFTGEQVPVYVGNYVLMYGTGAVMAVPAHDQRDFEFAQKYGIAIKPVIEPAKDADAETKQRYADFKANKAAFTDHGVMVNSGAFNGLTTEAGIKKIGETLATKNSGGFVTNFRIRDWGLSRQRYWGCPIPVIHCNCCGIVPVPEDQLPVKLPEDIEFMPTGQSPLESHKPFTDVACPKCKKPARRETDTMDTFVDSSWYFIRYADPKNAKSIAEKAKVEHWMPVDQYIGGSEHAILHLIYARFINKVLRDIGISNCDEPFARMYTQGMICRESIMIPSENSRYISHEEFSEAQKQNKYTDAMLVRRVEKMSKSAKNGVDPTILVDKFGADTVRGYTLFMGPAEAESVWDDAGVIGVHKFIKRWWDAQQTWLGKLDGAKEGSCDGAAKELRRLSHLFIEKTEREYSGGFGFNTCIAKAMEFVNFLRDNAEKFGDSPASCFAVKEALETLALCMAPITPHVSEELWAQLGHKAAVAQSPWPKHKPELTVQDEVEIAVQVNGKTRASMKVSKNASQDEMERIAKADPAVARHVEGKTVRKVILVPGRLLNIVVG